MRRKSKKRFSNKPEKPDTKREPQDQKESASTTGFNDYAWYNANPLLSEAAARIPFPYRPGMQIPTTQAGTNSTGFSRPVPGVLALQWAPSVGQSSLPTDPASIAAKEIFAKVRAAFSGSLDADGPDMVIYLLALDSIFSYIASCKRLYRSINAFTYENYLWPDALLAAQLPSDTATPVDVIANLRKDKAKLWLNINELIGMTRKFRCPDIFPLFKRHYWMNDNVYTDAPTPNSQTYVFNQNAYYKFGLDTISGDVKVGSVTLVQPTWTDVDGIYSFGRELIDALAGSDDAYIISGYLTRAFEGTGNFYVEELAQDEALTPYFMPEVLEQIHNTFTVMESSTVTSVLGTLKVTQNPANNAVVSNPSIPAPGPTVSIKNIVPKLSVAAAQPMAIDVVEASRLAAYIDSSNNIICGTELPLYWRYFQSGANPIGFLALQVRTGNLDSDGNYTNTSSWLRSHFGILAFISAFDWHPRWITCTLDSTNKLVEASEVWDIHNVTAVSEEDLRQINKICLLSEFNSFGSY